MIAFSAVTPTEAAVVVTVAGTAAALPGTEAGTVKVTPLAEYPGKGRGTGGVRCHKFRSGEDRLFAAWVGNGSACAATASGVPIDLPASDLRRDGIGVPRPPRRRAGRVAVTTCSAEALSVGERLAGSAPEASSWIVVEQPDPWGRQALLDSHLEPGARSAAHRPVRGHRGHRPPLARHPDRPGASARGAPQRMGVDGCRRVATASARHDRRPCGA